MPARVARFVLSAPPPVRALAISAALVVVGVGLLVATSAYGWPVGVLVVAVVLAVLGVALGLAALVVTRRVRSTVVTDAEQISVEHAGSTQSLRWAEIDTARVVGHRLLISRKEGEGGVSVLNPRRRANPTFLALLTEVQHRLDTDRGYSPFS